ncbi:unnamed protein product [Jaminaea pallidilutea]
MSFHVPKVNQVPDYDTFLREYLLPNKPCLLPPALIQDWSANEWASTSQHTLNDALPPAFAILADRYGDHQVPVVIDSPDGAEPERQEMTLTEATNKLQQACEARTRGQPHPLIYIKDWHLVRQERLKAAEDRRWPLPYVTPDLFADDWMNNDQGGATETDVAAKTSQPVSPEASGLMSTSDNQAARLTALPDDFRFCYAGMAGTKTGLHRDVYTSYSWSTNVVGRKRWKLYPPSLSQLLRRLDRGPALTAEEAAFVSTARESQAAVIDQEQGETIFVPSDCFHEVENLTDTISLNHNWCNSVNLPRMYEAMKMEVREVKAALSDVEEMLRSQAAANGQSCTGGGGGGGGGDEDVGAKAKEPWQREFWRLVQLVSRSDSGWDWRQFWLMVQQSLTSPSCPSDLRPDMSDFVGPRIEAMVEDFEGHSEEWEWLDEEVRLAVGQCGELARTYSHARTRKSTTEDGDAVTYDCGQ